METELFLLEDYKNTGVLSDADLVKIDKAAAILADGGLVAFPTETVYGLGGDALDKEASRHIYAAKGRPSDNPLIVHISDISQLDSLVKEITPAARKMAEKFWPGPLTMVYKKADIIPKETTGGLDTVAVRFPVHPVAMELIRRSGTVIAAPSANLSGRPSTTTAAHCVEDLTGRVDAIVDGGDCEIGLESTILDVSSDIPQLLRPGAITLEMIEETLDMTVPEDVAIKGPLAEGVRPKAPGMKYRHYAPKAEMVLVTAEKGGRIADKLAELLLAKQKEGKKTAVLCTDECLKELQQDAPEILSKAVIKTTGSRFRKTEAAHILFDALRSMDTNEVEYIAAEGYSEEQIGLALMNRMKKAAAWQIIEV